jgi:hypothetical protein
VGAEYPLGSPNRAAFSVTQAAIDDPLVDVHVIVRDYGGVVFDTTGQLQLHERPGPNGPGCSPTLFDGDVLATPEGDLIQQ